jgi:large subunit ribosomal protein L23
MQVIQKPVLSEKAMKHTADGKYVFQCVPSSNKIEIKKEVEKIFEVKVKSVRTLNIKPKATRRFTRTGILRGHTARRKKAYITLMPGYSIELTGVDTRPE